MHVVTIHPGTVRQTIPHRTWTLLSGFRPTSDHWSLYRPPGQIRIPNRSYWLFAAATRWAPHAGDNQLLTRFVRDPGGAHDWTGLDERHVTSGTNNHTHTWPFTAPYQHVAVEVWHDATTEDGDPAPMVITYAQLKAIQIG